MAHRLTVVISSTVLDLPLHRAQVRDACLGQEMFPSMMENLPANDSEAISASLRLVDEADVYVGVIAHRYGYVPRRRRISITEMEYNRAVERGIPRLIFIIDRKQPLSDFTISDIDVGDSANMLASFKSRLERENIVSFFKSPADLRACAIASLSDLRLREILSKNPADFPEHVRKQVEYMRKLLEFDPKRKVVGEITHPRAPQPSRRRGSKRVKINRTSTRTRL